MSTELIWQTVSISSENTEQLAEALGMRCRGGELIQLVSDLGGGKTTFVRGLARGIGSEDAVSSPSFTLSQEYRSPNLTLFHFDFYRLDDAGIVANELAELIDDKTAVIAVEWGDIVDDVLPADKVVITITNVGDDKRELKFSYPENLAYLIPEDN